MKNKATLLISSLAVAGLVSLTLPSVFAQTATTPTPAPAGKHERHPKIHAAIKALEDAKVDMQKADHDFGGHRAAALDECDKAIAQLKLALQFDKK
jgi:hypothetical protein